MAKTLLKNAQIVNEGVIFNADVLIASGKIERIDPDISDPTAEIVDLQGHYLLPGIIDDQVHFREPGLTHKADIFSESRAAAAGGITSFIEQPNTSPPAVTRERLEYKYALGAQNSLVNYGFMMGAANDSMDETLSMDPHNVPGIKVFMGSSTGNMLVDDLKVLDRLFAEAPSLVVTHCEDEQTIRENSAEYREQYGEDVPMWAHPLIRSEEACFLSSSMAVDLAKKHGTRLHVFHISTARELSLFRNDIPLEKKKITSEACIHHLWFDDSQYASKGSFIKWNPAVKTAADREAIFQAVLDDRIDVVATDHAPHTLAEKQQSYFNAPSGGPMVQHALVAMLEFYHRGAISLERIVDKMAHHPAILFRIRNRGFIREGYAADLVAINLDQPWTVTRDNLRYKCGWSPMEGEHFRSAVKATWVNGNLVYRDGLILDHSRGERLTYHVTS